MKVALLQQDILWASPAQNVARAAAAMDAAGTADLYVLPEMFTTGFATQPSGIAEAGGGVGLEWLRTQAQERDAAVAGSVAVAEDGKFYNRFYFAHPSGQVESYDKHHLFTYGGEHHTFSPGRQRVVVEHQGVRILLQVCYDLRFPVYSRNRGDYDMILYVASWPEPRVEAWRALLVARAIENQCYVAGVNRVGTDPACRYCGGTMLIDPYGHVIDACPDGHEAVARGVVNMNALRTFRQKFPVLGDADNFNLHF